jgi:uncharacterized protein (TIGR02996 family)
MTDTEDAFLRAICENPDEDTPRLVFADWLTEQGGPVNTAWANGMRAQIWLARGETDEALKFQTCVFDSRYGQEKLRERLELPQWVGGWERGFPSDASGPFHELSSAWPGLAFRIPIRTLRVYDTSEADAAEFVTWPALSVLSELDFGATWETPIRADVIPALASCESLRGLKVLALRYVIFSEASVTALLDSPHLAGLTALRLDIPQATPVLSQTLRNRLVTRFGETVFDDESIPF